jgi:hypothetical protein
MQSIAQNKTHNMGSEFLFKKSNMHNLLCVITIAGLIFTSIFITFYSINNYSKQLSINNIIYIKNKKDFLDAIPNIGNTQLYNDIQKSIRENNNSPDINKLQLNKQIISYQNSIDKYYLIKRVMLAMMLILISICLMWYLHKLKFEEMNKHIENIKQENSSNNMEILSITTELNQYVEHDYRKLLSVQENIYGVLSNTINEIIVNHIKLLKSIKETNIENNSIVSLYLKRSVLTENNDIGNDIIVNYLNSLNDYLNDIKTNISENEQNIPELIKNNKEIELGFKLYQDNYEKISDEQKEIILSKINQYLINNNDLLNKLKTNLNLVDNSLFILFDKLNSIISIVETNDNEEIKKELQNIQDLLFKIKNNSDFINNRINVVKF